VVRKSILTILLLVLSVVAAWQALRHAQEGREEEVRAAYGAYEKAFLAGDLNAMRDLVVAARRGEMDGEAAEAALAMAAEMRPASARLTSCSIEGEQAVLTLLALQEGGVAKGEVRMSLEDGVWRVAKESWKIEMGADSAAGEEDGPMAQGQMSVEVRELLDRIASEDPGTGALAWNRLGSRYTSAAAFLAEARPALWDDRPVAFGMAEGATQGFRYFTAKTEASEEEQVPAQTVGQALCYLLWNYEGIGGSGTRISFQEWWADYAAGKGLPAWE